MTLADLASLGSFVSGIAVLVSLVYLASQVRQGTKAARSQMHQSIVSGWLGVADLISGHADVFTRGLAADESRFTAMSDTDKLSFVTLAMAMFRHYENIYLQVQEGYVRQDDWAAWTRHLLMYFAMPGIKTMWKMRRSSFSPSFVAFVESAPPSPLSAPTDFFHEEP